MAHVVTSNIETCAEAPHQAGVHGPEAPEVNRRWQSQPFRYRLQVPVKQIVPIERPANLVGKDEVIRLAELFVARPHSPYRRENDAMFVKRHLPFASIRLHVVELIFVNTFASGDIASKKLVDDRIDNRAAVPDNSRRYVELAKRNSSLFVDPEKVPL
ncbi:MAG: hypothetical protein WA354_02470 [Terracidiphilus sp.]